MHLFSVMGTMGHFTANNVSLLETSKGKSYMCNKGATFELHDDNANVNNTRRLGMETKNLRFEAFKDGKKADFGGMTSEENRHSFITLMNSVRPTSNTIHLYSLII